MDRISGRIGDEVQMKPRQSQNATAANQPRSSLWINRRQPNKVSCLIPGCRSPPDIRRINAAIINRKTIIILIPGQAGVADSLFRLSRYHPQSNGFHAPDNLADCKLTHQPP
jgi:hypothetical protein